MCIRDRNYTLYMGELGRFTAYVRTHLPYTRMRRFARNALYTACLLYTSYTNSIWDKKRHLNPVENQAIFPDTHERSIDDDVFEKVQEIRSQRHRMTCLLYTS